MNSYSMARNAYGTTVTPLRTERGNEYQAFGKVTAALTAVQAAGSNEIAALASALDDNRKLWAILRDDVAHDDNELPMELRQQIYALSQFVLNMTPKVLSGAAKIDALIDINTAIMRGLRGDAGPGK